MHFWPPFGRPSARYRIVLALIIWLSSIGMLLPGRVAAQSSQPADADGALGTVTGDLIGSQRTLSGPSSSSNTDVLYDAERNYIYIAGGMTSLIRGNQTVAACGLARMRPNGTWDANFTLSIEGNFGCGSSVKLLLDGDYLYVAHSSFTTAVTDADGSLVSQGLFRIDLTTDRVDRDWLPDASGFFYSEHQLVALPKAGGGIMLAASRNDPYLSLFDPADDTSVTTVSGFSDALYGMTFDGTHLYVGGYFDDSSGPARLRRYNWDGSSLSVDSSWAPLTGSSLDIADLYNTGPHVVEDGYLYFSTSGTEAWRGLWRVAISGAADGTLDTTWRPAITRTPNALLFDGSDTLYLLGSISAPYNSIVRLDLRTNPPAIDHEFRVETGFNQLNGFKERESSDMAYAGMLLPATGNLPRRLLFVGTFATVNGVSSDSIAMVAVDGASMPTAPSISGVSGGGSGPYTITGRAQAGMQIIVYDGIAELGFTTADANGNWSFATGNRLARGLHTFSAAARYPHVAGRVLRSDSDRSNQSSVTVLTSNTVNPRTHTTPLIGNSGCENPIDGDGNNCVNRTLELLGNRTSSSTNYPPQHRPDLTPADNTNSRRIRTTGSAGNAATLTVRARDVDWAPGEMPKVYLNDRFLGYITGADESWSTTVLDIPDLGLLNDGVNRVRFGTSFFDNPWDDAYVTTLTSVAIEYDGGLPTAGTLRSADVPAPSSSIVTTMTSNVDADGLFQRTAGLINPSQQIVDEVSVTATLTTGDSPYDWGTATLESTADDYVGWTVRNSLLYWDTTDRIWITQQRWDVTYTELTLSSSDGRLVATVSPSMQLRTLAGGTVSFQLDGADLGSAPVDPDGRARLDLGDLPLGTYTFTAQYSGDRHFYASEVEQQVTTTPRPPQAQRCELVPDMAVSPQFITLAPGGTAQVEVALRNLCPDLSYGSADVLLSLSDGLTVISVPAGWLNLGQRAAIQNLVLQPGETVRYLITVSAGDVLPTAPLHISELYVGGQVLKRIDGVFLLPEGTAVGAPAPAEAVPTAPAEPAPAEPSAPELPLTLPNTAAAPGSLAWPLLLSAFGLLLLGRRIARRNG